MTRMFLISFLIFVTGCESGKNSQSGLPHGIAADVIFTNGKIITVDPSDSIVAALAIRDGRIIALGSDAEIEALAGDATRLIDLQGYTTTPGLIDSHNHFAYGLVNEMVNADVSYPAVKSIEDVVQVVGRRVADMRAGEWVQGVGWDEGKLLEQRYIEAADLDTVSPDNPVWLMHTMGHYGVANSAAMKLANITAETPEVPGGRIERDASGTPTGVLKEAAMGLVLGFLPDFTPEQRDAAIEAGARAMNAEGITAVKDPGIGLKEWESYQRVHARDALSVRIFVLWSSPDKFEDAEALVRRVQPFTRPYESSGDNQLISGGIKIFADGSGGARTAWMHEDWNKDFDGTDTDNKGFPALPADVLERQINLYHDAGLHIGVHAIGDRAIDFVVDTYATMLEKTPTKGLRHSLIHCNIPTDHALDVMARLQRDYDAAYPEIQSTFTWWIGDTYAGNFGPERGQSLKPLASFVERGIRFGGGSDFPVTPYAPRYGLWSSIMRETLIGTYGKQPFGTDEAIDIRTALKSYTIWNAPQLFLEEQIGSLEVGKYADLVVWDTDLYTASPEAIKEMRALMTVIQGETVYRADEF